ncbi:MAG: translation initiation factor IF-3 [Brevinemataceae bacterium]
MDSKKPENKDQIRINERITAPELRVLDSEGQPLGILSLKAALDEAEKLDLDLVEISPNAEPPVARIINYGKFLYQKEKKLKEARKNQKTVEVKEIKFGPHIDKHDFDYRVKRIVDFLNKGDKVKVSIRFRGREMAHTDLGFDIIKRILEQIGDVVIEKSAKLEGKQILMFLAPSKNSKK